jgi:hypothetical protein
MSEQTEKSGNVELRVEVKDDTTDVYFWHEGDKHPLIYFEGGCEEYFIGDNPISESICAWATLRVIEFPHEGKKTPKVDFRTNVVSHETKAILERLASNANRAISDGKTTAIDITEELREVLKLEWNITFSVTVYSIHRKSD